MNRLAVEARSEKPRGARRRPSLIPNTVVLLLAIIGLIAFIGIMGDARRTRNALHQAEVYAKGYAQRASQTKVLPLNLEPNVPGESEPKLIDFDWLGSEHVRLLRQTSDDVLAAWSVPVLKFFGRDGRAAVFFRHGGFDVKWMPLAEFDEAQAAQSALVVRLAGSGR